VNSVEAQIQADQIDNAMTLTELFTFWTQNKQFLRNCCIVVISHVLSHSDSNFSFYRADIHTVDTDKHTDKQTYCWHESMTFSWPATVWSRQVSVACVLASLQTSSRNPVASDTLTPRDPALVSAAAQHNTTLWQQQLLDTTTSRHNNF